MKDSPNLAIQIFREGLRETCFFSLSISQTFYSLEINNEPFVTSAVQDDQLLPLRPGDFCLHK